MESWETTTLAKVGCVSGIGHIARVVVLFRHSAQRLALAFSWAIYCLFATRSEVVRFFFW